MAKHMFISTQNGWFSRLALWSSLLVLIAILLETYTRTIGPANPIWIWTEILQRYIPLLVGGMIFLLVCSAWQLRHKYAYKPFIIGLMLVLLAVGEISLGQLRLSLELQPIIELLHLLISVAILSLFWWASSMIRPNTYTISYDSNKRFRLWAWAGLILIFAQITLGAWASSHHAELICTDFPFCNQELFPHLNWHSYLLPFDKSNVEALTTFHMAHRFGVFITALYISIFSILLILNRQLCEMAMVLLLLLTSQVILGIMSLIWLRPVWMVVTYEAIAALLLLTMISLLINLYRNGNDY